MKRLLLALVAALPAASPAWAAGVASGSPTAGRTTAPPSMAGAFLSLLYPGGGQFYGGDPVRGYVYLGLGLGGGLLGFGAMMAQLPAGVPASIEETALSGLVGYGVMLAFECVSTLDALIEIGGEQDDTAALAKILVPAATTSLAPLPVAAGGAPQDVPTDSDTQRILQAYALADHGDHVGAIADLAMIRSPAFGPKIQALTRQWGAAAASELVAAANRLAWQGKIQEALATIDKALSLPVDPAVGKQAQRLRERLEKTFPEEREGAANENSTP